MVSPALPDTRRGHAERTATGWTWYCGNCDATQGSTERNQFTSWCEVHDNHQWRMTPFHDIGIVCPECCGVVWPHALGLGRESAFGAGGFRFQRQSLTGVKSSKLMGTLSNPESFLRGGKATARKRRQGQTPVAVPTAGERTKRVKR